MCDTLCARRDGVTIFAKNSDRPVDEVQVVRHFAARQRAAVRLHTQYLDVGEDPGAREFAGSQPTWLWGVEHGVNIHGVAVGNEKIWTTTDPRPKPAALLGMDIVRLALERAATADEACEIVGSLVEEFGQGGSGEESHHEPYDSSFLVADAAASWIIETNHTQWAARRTTQACAISNRVSLTDDWDRADPATARADDRRVNVQEWRAPRVPTALADHRLAATAAAANSARSAHEIAAAMRDHGTGPWGDPTTDPVSPAPIPQAVGDDFRGVTVCMHVAEYQTTTGSMIVELLEDHGPGEFRTWWALGAPCVSIYVPSFGTQVPGMLSDAANWHRFDALRRRAEQSTEAAASIRSSLGAVEQRWWNRVPERPDARAASALQDIETLMNHEVDTALRSLDV